MNNSRTLFFTGIEFFIAVSFLMETGGTPMGYRGWGYLVS